MLELESQIKVIAIDPSKSSSVGCRRVPKPESLTSSTVFVEETNVGEQVTVCCCESRSVLTYLKRLDAEDATGGHGARPQDRGISSGYA
jgi:hypothetical protein